MKDLNMWQAPMMMRGRHEVWLVMRQFGNEETLTIESVVSDEAKANAALEAHPDYGNSLIDLWAEKWPVDKA